MAQCVGLTILAWDIAQLPILRDLIQHDQVRHHHPDLLRRTLDSIACVEHPGGLERIYVIENGPRAGADTVCKDYLGRLPLVYIYEETPGLSNARNVGATHATSPILLFIDDDIRMLRDTLSSYDDAFQRHGPTCFFGGPLTPDYETQPEPFLVEFLPCSAKGPSLGEKEIDVGQPLFLGGNIAEYRLRFGKTG